MSRRSRSAPGRRDRRRPSAGKPIVVSSPSLKSVATVPPPPLKEGQVRCMVCRNATRTTPRGYLRKHTDLFGGPCFNRSTGEPTHVAAPPIELPPEPHLAPVAELGDSLRERHAAPKSASRLDVGSECRECGKWLPGERSLCGRCFVVRRNR